MAEEHLDAISISLATLRTELSQIAHVDHEAVEHGIAMTQVTPRNPDALPMSWIDMGGEIVFEAGRHGGRWELAKTAEDIAFMERLIKSIVEGRARETFGPKRSQVQVTFEDGTKATETGYASWLPIPGWRRRGRTVTYAPYGH